MAVRVKMTPHLSHFRSEVSGIATVIKKWFQHLPKFDIELVKPDAKKYDLVAAHAGMTGAECDIAHLHGLYFSADYAAPAWEYEINARIVQAVRNAKAVTVPSSWVATLFQRDMRFTPHIIGHGVDWDEWQHNEPDEGYILAYGKNRMGTDVCDPSFVTPLARRFPYLTFVVTFAPKGTPSNVQQIGLTPHEEFKKVIQRASVVISPIKETWGVMQAEAMAAGKPILGINKGGNLDLIQHGQTGYLYDPGDPDDIAEGLTYCLKYRRILGENGRELARDFTWEAAVEKVAGVYRLAMAEDNPHSIMATMNKPLPLVSIIIPCHDKASTIKRAISSVKAQTLNNLECFVILDRCSDGSSEEAGRAIRDDLRFNLCQVNHGNVADTRNFGASQAKGLFLCFLDGDDWIDEGFLEVCVKELLADRSLGAAYTGLTYHKPDGSTGLSPWPTEWNYDEQLAKKNQIPTCSVIRKEAWDRLGGQRSRYCGSRGAGAEDGEFYLRLGAYGWGAKKVTEEGLFHYSWMSGLVTGDPSYSEPAYQAWHPWTKDEIHPFASYATPKRQSHPVQQFDEPEVSVIIPVGPGHEGEVINALDSLEAQTFRKWEAILVSDTGKAMTDWSVQPEKSYPYVRRVKAAPQTKVNGHYLPFGAGHSRNLGAKMARSPLLLFLDADDTLHPDALEKMLKRWNETGQAVYCDYVGQAYISEEHALSLEEKNRLQSFNPRTGEAIIGYQAFDFDCARALRQPEPGSPYIWNLITTLHPRAWHSQIGGFDEAMDTWEDWDYWLRLVRAGHCFTRIPEQLVRYRFYTGKRRSLASADTAEGRQKAEAMLKYMSSKYERLEGMGCGCKNNGKDNGTATIAAMQTGMESMADSNFVRARYTGKQGNHHIWGDTFFETNPGPPARKAPGGGWKFYYGYASRGLETLIYREDVKLKPNDWQILPEKINQIETVIQRPGPPVPMLGMPSSGRTSGRTPEVADGRRSQAGASLPQPVAITEAVAQPQVAGLDLQQLPGVGGAIAQRMTAAGLTTREAILEAGQTGLEQIQGVTPARAVAILKALE